MVEIEMVALRAATTAIDRATLSVRSVATVVERLTAPARAALEVTNFRSKKVSTEPETITVPLSRPITHEGKTIASLTFREATAGDACAAELVEHDFQRTLALLASMSEISLPLAKKIPLGDVNSIVSKVSHSMGEQPAVGGQT